MGKFVQGEEENRWEELQKQRSNVRSCSTRKRFWGYFTLKSCITMFFLSNSATAIHTLLCTLSQAD